MWPATTAATLSGSGYTHYWDATGGTLNGFPFSLSSYLSLTKFLSLSPLPLSSSLILTHPFPIDQSSPPLHLTLTLFPSLPPMSQSPDEEQSSVRKFASLDFHYVVFYSQIHSFFRTSETFGSLEILKLWSFWKKTSIFRCVLASLNEGRKCHNVIHVFFI